MGETKAYLNHKRAEGDVFKRREGGGISEDICDHTGLVCMGSNDGVINWVELVSRPH